MNFSICYLKLQCGIVLCCFPKGCHWQAEGMRRGRSPHGRTLPGRGSWQEHSFSDGKSPKTHSAPRWKGAVSAQNCLFLQHVTTSAVSAVIVRLKGHPRSLQKQQMWSGSTESPQQFWECPSAWQNPPTPSSNSAA